MDTQKLGFMLGQAVMGARDKWLSDISKIVGEVDDDISKEYLVLLMWTATWIVSRTLGQYVEPTLDVMDALLYAEMIDNANFETFIHDRYVGYYAAIRDKSGNSESMGLFHVSQYFLACCHSSGGTVKYEELVISGLLEADKEGLIRDGVAEKIRSLYDTKHLPNCTMDIHKIAQIIPCFTEFGKDVESLVLDFVKEL